MLTNMLGNKGKSLGILITTSGKLFGHPEILKPTYRRILFSAFCHIFFLCSLILIVQNFTVGHKSSFDLTGIYMLLIFIFILWPYSYYYSVKMKARQAWMVYASITQKNVSYSEARSESKKYFWSLCLLTGLDMFLSSIKNTNENKRGIIYSILVSAMGLVLDIVDDFLMAAIIVGKKTIKEAVVEIKNLKNNIPAALLGVLGPNIFGGTISFLLLFVDILILAAGYGLGAYLTSSVPNQYIIDFQDVKDVSSHLFFPFPLIAAIVLIVFLHKIIDTLVSSIECTYYTVFYVSLSRPNEIDAKLRADLTDYLHVKEVKEVKDGTGT